MITLALDAATSVGTVAIFREDELIASGEVAMKSREAERLTPLVVDVLQRGSLAVGDIDRIACGAGPGSFTSLRIAASIAKGLAVGRGLPVFALPSLALIVAANVAEEQNRYIAVLDALRGESYAQLVTVADGIVAMEATHLVVPTSSVPALAEERGARVAGPDFPGDWRPHAKGAGRLFRVMEAGGPVNLSSWEPTYGRKAEAQSRWEAVHGRALDG